jgi:SNF2 family DNA or RNA helicase
MGSTYDILIDELDENSPQSIQPENSKIILWPHQLSLLHKCKEYENNTQSLTQYKSLCESNHNIKETDYLRTQVGIIGDRVGSGKSFVILSLIANNDITNLGSTVKSFANNRVILCFTEQSINIKTNLLVIPHNLVSQWESYIKTFSDTMKYLIISKVKHLDNMLQNEQTIPTYDLIVVTQSCYVRVAHFLTSRSFKMQRVIYDEIDTMNLPNCITIDSNFYWFVTASYGNLLYPRGYDRWDHSIGKRVWYATGLKNSGFVKDLFMDLHLNLSKDYVKILVLKNRDEYVQSSIDLPPTINKYIKCKTPLTINVLDGFVDREIIQSLNAGDIVSALQRISPSHRNSEDNLVKIQIEKYARELVNYEVRLKATYELLYDNEDHRTSEIQRLQKKMDEVKVKIDGIKERIQNTETCCICYDTIQNKSIAPCCSNTYCFLCINIWLANHELCPLCKTKLLPHELLVVDDNELIDNNIVLDDSETNDNFDKLKNLEIIIRDRSQTGKILLCSSYDMSFSSITNILDNMNVKYAYLKGNEAHILKLLDKYKNTNELNVLLVNSRNYGSGLNLENTTDIIMFHKVESETEKQVIGRASRIGRTCPLNVWYLLYDNEIRQIEDMIQSD